MRNAVALFRADDRNFVFTMPDGPLVQTTVIDVSHESAAALLTIEQPGCHPSGRTLELRRLAEQVEAKDAPYAAERNALLRAMHWRRLVTEGWSRRYVEPGVWQGIQKFIRDSEATARKTANRNPKPVDRHWHRARARNGGLDLYGRHRTQSEAGCGAVLTTGFVTVIGPSAWRRTG